MDERKYDFAGWVTKNDIRCSDGVTIKHDAFKGNDGHKVPLVWNHDYNSPNNVLGHVRLKNESTGVYGYGFFNDTEEATNAQKLVKHGDISSMSIGARKIKRAGTDVIHGMIYEVSLVLAAANPGAMIDSIMSHSEEGDEEKGIIYPGTLIHSSDDIIEHKEGGTKVNEEEEKEVTTPSGTDTDEKTIGDVIETMTEEQKEAVYALIGLIEESEASEEDEDENTKDDEKGEDETMKQNVFNQTEGQSKQEETLKHSINEVLTNAVNTKAQSLQDLLKSDDKLTHGINSIEMLFPEAAQSTNGNVPILYKDPNTSYKEILNATSKSPFSRIKTTVADITEEEARAKGYIKGNMKKEEFFSLIKRQTTPATIYKKQKLDRDDIIDITDFDVVAFMNGEMRIMLEEEIARAILVGDGRSVGEEDKINESNIRPVISDNDFFTIKKTYADAAGFIESVIKAMSEYRGSGQPTMYVDPTLLADVKLLKGTDGRFLFGDIPSTQAIAARLGLKDILDTSFMIDKGALIVNLRDYTVGASKGGQITNFDDFDIDFNQYKYLIETRLCGALTLPKSAIHVNHSTAGTGATDEDAGLSFGKRQADKTEPEEEPEV